MATTRVGVYRKYHGPIPKDRSGQQLPKQMWPEKRSFSWAVRWYGTDGKRYSKSFDTRKEAERFAEDRQSKVREGKADPPPRITIREFYKEHKELMNGNVAPKTLHLHLATLALLAKSLGWDRHFCRITPKDIERFRAGRLQAGLGAASANKEVKTLRRIMNLATVRGYLQHAANPCTAIPMLKVGRKRPPYCSPEQFAKMYGAARDAMWRTMLVVLYSTGLRLREALNLTWGDIDFASGQLHVTRKDASGSVQAWTPKDHEMRSIPLPEQAINMLTQWQPSAPEGCPYVFMDQGRWEFYRQEVKASRWRPEKDLVNNMLRKYRTICRRAGVDAFTIHDLRRSCITNWARRIPIHVAQQLAGHSDIKTTQQFYLSVSADDVAKAQKAQGSMLSLLPEATPTDPKLTHSGRKRVFPGRRVFARITEPLENQGVVKRTLQDSNLQPSVP